MTELRQQIVEILEQKMHVKAISTGLDSWDRHIIQHVVKGHQQATDALLPLLQKETEWYKPEDKLPEDREPRICLMRSLEITHKRYYKLTHLNPSKTEFYVTYDDDGKAPIEKVVCWTDIPPFPQCPQ
jgi:hypothetical protein